MSRLNVANFRHPDGTADNINLDSSGRVGIGTSDPKRHLHIHETATGTNTYLQLSNPGTGQTNTDGFQLICANDGEAIVMQRENQPLSFYTNNTERARITSTGDLRFNSGYGSVATAYGVRAWIDFDGTLGTPVTNGSGNMDALTDNADGDYTLNFTNNMPDANYAVLCGLERDATSYLPNVWAQSRAVGSVDIYSGLVNASSTLIPWDLVIFAAIVR